MEKEYTRTQIQLLSTTTPIQSPKNILVLQLQTQIINIVTQQQQKDLTNYPHLQKVTDDLENMVKGLKQNKQGKIKGILQNCMHALAVNKILVFTHGKSDFRLVIAHFDMGRAYLECQCYEQAISHLTIASTKIAKMGDIKQTKIYHSYILTTLARCYMTNSSHQHALELLVRAYDIQSNHQNVKGSSLALQTLQLLALANLRSKFNKEAIKITDKLIDILQTQLDDFQNLLTKLQDLQQRYDNIQEDELQIKIDNITRKGGDYLQLIKPFETLAQKLEFLIIEYDRRQLRQLLPSALQSIENVLLDENLFDTVLNSVSDITLKLLQELHRIKILKFKIYLEGEGEYLTNTVEEQLKQLIKIYEQQQEKIKNQEDEAAYVRKGQLIELYKLLFSYCTRFSNLDTQLEHLKTLQSMLIAAQELPSSQQKLEILKIKRNMAMIYQQKRQPEDCKEVLRDIKDLEKELYGKNSDAVRKTRTILKMFEEENKGVPNSRMHLLRMDRLPSTTKKLVI